MKTLKSNKLKFIDVFCGAGGFSCGLQMVGLECLLGIDFDKYAIETFAKNHPNAETFHGPIQKLNKKILKGTIGDQTVDLVVGGPPCQGFSTVGTGNPNDIRNNLFMEFVKIVKITSPSFIIIENVLGILAKKNKKTLDAILRSFKSMGYNIDVKVLKSDDYKIASNRRRTIFIGSRINNNILFPTFENSKKTVGQVFKKLNLYKKSYNHDLKSTEIKNSLDYKRLKYIPEGKSIRYKKDEDLYLPKSLKLGINWKKIPEGRLRQCKYQRLNRNLTAPTIMTNRHAYFHPTENRYLTVREAASLQSFPNSFKFYGSISAQWKQIGNAVPPLLAKALGKTIMEMKQISANSRRKIINSIKSENISNIRSNAFKYKDAA